MPCCSQRQMPVSSRHPAHGGPEPHRHWPPEQEPVPLQFTQAEPFWPHVESLAATQWVASEQQPEHPELVLQTQVPFEQARPGPQGPPLPQWQLPPSQLSALPCAQAEHAAPLDPQTLAVSAVVVQVLPEQQPAQPGTGRRRYTCRRRRCSAARDRRPGWRRSGSCRRCRDLTSTLSRPRTSRHPSRTPRCCRRRRTRFPGSSRRHRMSSRTCTRRRRRPDRLRKRDRHRTRIGRHRSCSRVGRCMRCRRRHCRHTRRRSSAAGTSRRRSRSGSWWNCSRCTPRSYTSDRPGTPDTGFHPSRTSLRPLSCECTCRRWSPCSSRRDSWSGRTRRSHWCRSADPTPGRTGFARRTCRLRRLSKHLSWWNRTSRTTRRSSRSSSGRLADTRCRCSNLARSWCRCSHTSTRCTAHPGRTPCCCRTDRCRRPSTCRS